MEKSIEESPETKYTRHFKKYYIEVEEQQNGDKRYRPYYSNKSETLLNDKIVGSSSNGSHYLIEHDVVCSSPEEALKYINQDKENDKKKNYLKVKSFTIEVE